LFEKLNDHPLFAIIGAIGVVVGIITGVLSLTEPTYAKVTDGRICGYTERTETSKPYKWNECENPSKVTGYRYHETISKSSGRVGGGFDQNWHCTNVKREKEKAVGQSIIWSNQKSTEKSEKDDWGHVTYKYHCTIDAAWGPIYKVERWESCGEAAAVIQVIKEEKTCYDKTKRVGWKWKWE
jgi:hypothetical protein